MNEYVGELMERASAGAENEMSHEEEEEEYWSMRISINCAISADELNVFHLNFVWISSKFQNLNIT